MVTTLSVTGRPGAPLIHSIHSTHGAIEETYPNLISALAPEQVVAES